MSTQEVLNKRNEKGIMALSNEAAGWSAISRENTHMITFFGDDITYKFYKNEKSFAIRVSQLLRKGY